MKLRYIFSFLPALVLMASCNSSGGDDGGIVCLDIATLESSGDAGSVFTVQQSGDAPLVTLLTRQQFDSKTFEEGSRVIIQYTPQNNLPYTSGNITVTGISNTLGGGKPATVGTALENNNWASAKIDARTIWRTGKYINLQFQGDTGGDPSVYSLVFDQETLNTDYPTAHFIFRGSVGGMTQTYVFYASYDISEFWNIPGIKGIKVLYMDREAVSDAPSQVVIIKEKSELTPTE